MLFRVAGRRLHNVYVANPNPEKKSFNAFKKVKVATKMDNSCKLNILSTDRGSEFNSNEFRN